ncbi:GNAT family N-acetyltransferase [Qipengyuania sp. XHP0207]|uniref:GNAT family N-acetyltransferase n=1 Tax=Qipengyuania sp. XHP0207 TaxID=3038078 RepID=UPI00241D0415|nr:GNAT family N-acetyltransferase [Qipengyuania sp. XHP0207]MDG5749435.1 GNAT family N-acetyltransferase [Qipengyuania sp. XHP0207]
MAYAIRPFRDDDAEAVADVCAAAIEAIGPRAYSKKQVAAWRARHPGAQRYRDLAAEGAEIIVAVDDAGNPVAYALLERDGHLDHLYSHPDHTRQGLADQLLAEAEVLARKWGEERLYTEASELARPAFERVGYAVTHKREFEIDGVAIHNWAMEKALD